jgi:Asp-tRNA(Asn)/Glu-tRNA(Gln) amidotransferase A subunit family amidase
MIDTMMTITEKKMNKTMTTMRRDHKSNTNQRSSTNPNREMKHHKLTSSLLRRQRREDLKQEEEEAEASKTEGNMMGKTTTTSKIPTKIKDLITIKRSTMKEGSKDLNTRKSRNKVNLIGRFQSRASKRISSNHNNHQRNNKRERSQLRLRRSQSQ